MTSGSPVIAGLNGNTEPMRHLGLDRWGVDYARAHILLRFIYAQLGNP